MRRAYDRLIKPPNSISIVSSQGHRFDSQRDHLPCTLCKWLGSYRSDRRFYTMPNTKRYQIPQGNRYPVVRYVRGSAEGSAARRCLYPSTSTYNPRTTINNVAIKRITTSYTYNNTKPDTGQKSVRGQGIFAALPLLFCCCCCSCCRCCCISHLAASPISYLRRQVLVVASSRKFSWSRPRCATVR